MVKKARHRLSVVNLRTDHPSDGGPTLPDLYREPVGHEPKREASTGVANIPDRVPSTGVKVGFGYNRTTGKVDGGVDGTGAVTTIPDGTTRLIFARRLKPERPIAFLSDRLKKHSNSWRRKRGKGKAELSRGNHRATEIPFTFSRACPNHT